MQRLKIDLIRGYFFVDHLLRVDICFAEIYILKIILRNVERVLFNQTSVKSFFGLVYNFKSVSDSCRTRTSIFGIGSDLAGPFTTLVCVV